jgi:hypothetical protein
MNSDFYHPCPQSNASCPAVTFLFSFAQPFPFCAIQNFTDPQFVLLPHIMSKKLPKTPLELQPPPAQARPGSSEAITTHHALTLWHGTHVQEKWQSFVPCGVRPRVTCPLWGIHLGEALCLEEGNNDGEKTADYSMAETEKIGWLNL